MRDRSSVRTWIVFALAAGFYPLAWRDLAGFQASIDFNTTIFADFMGPYLEMARAEDPTRIAHGFLYSPFFALLLRPLRYVDPGVASWIWLVVQVLASAAVVFLPLRILRPRGALRDGYLFVALTGFPLVHGFHWGQVSALLVAAALLGVVARASRHPRWAGVCLALAISVKFYPALWLLPFLCLEDWRVVGTSALASVVFLVLLPLAWIGPEGTLRFYGEIVDTLARLRGTLWADAPNMQYLPAVLARATGGGTDAFQALAWGSLLAAAGIVAAIVSTVRRSGAAALPWAMGVAFATTPLVVSPSWPHYFAYLPFCQLVCASTLLDGHRSPLARRMGIAAVGLSVVLSSAVLFRVVDDPVRYADLGLLAAADTLVLVVALSIRPRTEAARA